MANWQEQLPECTYPFKGWDWTELADCWGIKCPQEIEDDEDPYADEQWLSEEIKKKIWTSVVFDVIKDPQVLADTYTFIKKVSEVDHGVDHPVITAILSIEHPWSFNKWVAHNLEFFWT